MPRVALSLLAALCAALALAACGGGGGGTTGGATTSGGATAESTTSGGATTSEGATAEETTDEETAPDNGPPDEITEPTEESSGETSAQAKPKIEAAIVASVSGNDPANCTKLEAPGFVEQTTGLSGEEAIQACEQQAAEGGNPGQKVTVKSVEAIGESAVALVAISGGTLDGQTLEVAIRREGGNWRLGRMIGFKGFDREAFLTSLGEAIAEEGGAAAKARKCVLERLAVVPSKEFENSILTGASPGIVAAFESCQ